MGLRDFLRNPFSFMGTRSTGEDRIAVYILREHERGRALSEILEDPYVRNRTTPREQQRILERPEIIQALGDDIAGGAREPTA